MFITIDVLNSTCFDSILFCKKFEITFYQFPLGLPLLTNFHQPKWLVKGKNHYSQNGIFTSLWLVGYHQSRALQTIQAISRITGNRIATQIHKYHPILIIIPRNIFFSNSKQNGGEGRFTAHWFLYRNVNLLSNGVVNPLLPNSN